MLKQMPNEPTHIWYVSYGSNLLKRRFMVYIQGGRAPGGMIDQPGSTDHTPPSRDIAIDIPVRLYFGGQSRVYNGSVAFVDPGKTSESTMARAYLVTREQFWQIVRQENMWLDMPPAEVPTVAAIRQAGTALLTPPATQADLYPSQYPRVVYLGERDGYPLLTFTSDKPHSQTGKPSELYLKTMSTGFYQSRNITAKQIAAYLVNKPGVAGKYTLDELEILAAQPGKE